MFAVDVFFFFFKQKTAYEMRISDWSSDVCSSDLAEQRDQPRIARGERAVAFGAKLRVDDRCRGIEESDGAFILAGACHRLRILHPHRGAVLVRSDRKSVV